MNFYRTSFFFKLVFLCGVLSLYAEELTLKDYLKRVYEANFDIKKSVLDIQEAVWGYQVGNLEMYTPHFSYKLELDYSKKNILGIPSLDKNLWGAKQSLGIEQPLGIWGTKLGFSYDYIHKTPFNLVGSQSFPNSIEKKDVGDFKANKDFSRVIFSIKQSLLGKGNPFFSENKNKIKLLQLKKQLAGNQKKVIVQNILIKSWVTALEYITRKTEEEMVEEELLVAQKIYQFKKKQFDNKSIRKTDLYAAESFFIQKEMSKKKILNELQDLLSTLQKLANLQEEFSFLDFGESMELDLERLRPKFSILERPDLSLQNCLQDIQVVQNKVAFSESFPNIGIVANIGLHSGVARNSWVDSISNIFKEYPEFSFFVSITSPLIPKVMKKDLLGNHIKLQKQRESLIDLQNQSIREVAISEKRWKLAKDLMNDSEKNLINSRNILLENRKNLQNGKIDLDDYFRSEERYEQSFGLKNKCKLQEQMLFLSFLVSQGIQISSLLYE